MGMTRQEAIKNIKEHCYFASLLPQAKEALDVAIKVLEQKTRWISVSERLPEESTAVLIWCPERRNIYCACFENNRWWIFGAYFVEVKLEVKAWMPLPEPYKGRK